MRFFNSTELDDHRLEQMFLRHTHPYRHSGLTVRVRYSRGAAFSGSCYYRDHRIFVNLGRGNRYPYSLNTHLARARSDRTHWWRETYALMIDNAYQLSLFVYLHELFHFLVSGAGRNMRRKEAMCDRFSARVLVDHYACLVLDIHGRAVERTAWDFQDLERFVAAAPRERVNTPRDPPSPSRREIPVTIRGMSGASPVHLRDTR